MRSGIWRPISAASSKTAGENVAAFIVARPGARPKPEELQAFCRDALASYEVPRHVFVVEQSEVPVTGTGKIERPTLRREAAARVAAGG